LSDGVFKTHIDTETMTLEAVAAEIGLQAGLMLLPDHAGYVRRHLDRLKTQLAHIRWFR
jgi:hypothetical protein